jgi:uncharacterized protein (TIGR04255 family)
MAYNKPPIIEAVIEFRFATPVPFSEADKAAKRALSYYPVDQTDFEFQTQMEAASGRVLSTKQAAVGRRLSSSDRAEVLLIGTQALLFAQLAPYPGWDVFFNRVMRDYDRVKESLGHREFARVGVRYINRLDIPTKLSAPPPEGSPTQFLNLGIPTIPIGGDRPKAYTFQIDKSLDEYTLLTLISATVEPLVPNTWALVLDLDLGRTVEIPKRDDELWAMIEQLRDLKNQVFEACITDATRKLIE